MFIADKIHSNIEKIRIPHENSLTAQVVTLSLGVRTMEDTALDITPEELVNQADMALYKAKEQGRNQCQFFSEIA